MNLVGQIEAALTGDALENTAVTEAQALLATAEAAVVDAQTEVTTTTDSLAQAQTLYDDEVAAGGDTTDEHAALDLATTAKANADTALIDAEAVVVTVTLAVTTAQGEASSEDTLGLIAQLKVTDYNMISDATMALILAAQGKEVLFDTPENVISNHAMEIVVPSETDVTPVGK